jgi:alpha,alpha-trehalase
MLSLSTLAEDTKGALRFIDEKWGDLLANARFGHTDCLSDWSPEAATSHDGHLGEGRDAEPPYILYLPNDFIRPGGRFMVQFYWDSYFINLALLNSGRTPLAKGIVENCFHLIERHGMVISNRKRWSAGSQLPFLSRMIADVFRATRDTDWLRRAVEFAEREYSGYWLNQDHLTNTGLSRYHAPPCFPSESIAAITIDHEATWDLTPRFEAHDVLHLVPVDLNSNLYAYEKDLAAFYGELGDEARSDHWRRMAERRSRLITELLWNDADGLFYDYDFVARKHKRVRSLATFFPLFHGQCDHSQAARVVKHLSEFEYRHGLATCDRSYGFNDRQWNFPLGWAPLHWIAYTGLNAYGYEKDAQRVALKWLSLNLDVWRRTSCFFEKYDVVAGTHETLTDRYRNQEGFGWTNAIFQMLTMDLLKKSADERPARTPIDSKAEYEHLNKEIAENSNKVHQVLGLCVTATAALLVLGPKGDLKAPFDEFFYPFAAFFPFAIILPSVFLVESSLHATVRIASYIRVVHEKNALTAESGSLSWQTAMQRSRDHEACPSRRSSASYASLFWLLIGACLFVSLWSFVRTTTKHWAAGPEMVSHWTLTLFIALYLGALWTLVRSAYTRIKGMRECFHRKTFDQWEEAWRKVLHSPSPERDDQKLTWAVFRRRARHAIKWWVCIESSFKPDERRYRA